MKAAECVEYERVTLLAEALQSLGGGQRRILIGAIAQPEDSLSEQGLGASNAIGLITLQPDQTPLTTMGEIPAQRTLLDSGHEARLSPALVRGSNIPSPI
ncbi:hypothetical protein D3C85_1551740 [compost metagenome]